MKKLLIGLVLSAGVVMASDMHQDDLLSMATMGKTTGTQFEMNNDEMKDVNGGYYYSGYGSTYYNSNISARNSTNANTRIYASAWGNYYWGGSSWR